MTEIATIDWFGRWGKSVFSENTATFVILISDIMNRKARLAWELYLKMETSGESFSLLQLIANDCYKVCIIAHVCLVLLRDFLSYWEN